jgi:hypothetical protein
MKHKKVKRGMVRPDTIFPLYNQVDGEWYATITARYADADAEPILVIAGPFADVEEAKAHNRKWLEASRHPSDDVRFWHKADISRPSSNVRSGQSLVSPTTLCEFFSR